MTDINMVVDDCGMHWRYSWVKGKIYCVEAENELRQKHLENQSYETLEELEQNGYYVDSFEDGFELLIEYGYITRAERE